MDHEPALPRQIARDILERLRRYAPTSTLGVPSIEGIKDTPSTWRFINRHRAEVIDAFGEVIEGKIELLGKLRQLRLAYEEYLDIEAEVEMRRDGTRMSHERMRREHELEMIKLELQKLQLELELQQARAGLSDATNGAGVSLEEKLKRLPTLREKMFLLSAQEKAELQAVLDAGYDKDGREWNQVLNKFDALKERVIGGEL
jgi:hypothetical protein